MKTFYKNGNIYKGICFINKDSREEMEYEFADFICEDILLACQLNFGPMAPIIRKVFKDGIIAHDSAHNVGQTLEDLETSLEALVVQAGTSYDNHDGTWTHDYEGTLYVFHNDWLMLDTKNNRLLVVDEKYIKEFEEMTE